jgi:hypothetical protein
MGAVVIPSAARDLLLALAIAVPHPIHTTVLELKLDPGSNAISGTLRIFEDDLRAASGKAGTVAYVLRNVELSASGKVVGLEACGERRAADAVLICLRATAPDPGPLQIRNTLLMERFEDQVNIVRVDKGAGSTLLLTRRSSTQTIR